MSDQKDPVRKFYAELWDARDGRAVLAVLHRGCTFSCLLGRKKLGHEGFASDVDSGQGALGEYRCHIQELAKEDDWVFARRLFSDSRQYEILSGAATGVRRSW